MDAVCLFICSLDDGGILGSVDISLVAVNVCYSQPRHGCFGCEGLIDLESFRSLIHFFLASAARVASSQALVER